jgi:ketosteroid isomerase-like protein
MPTPITAEAVTAFLVEFERLAERQDFGLIRDLIDEHAFFRFNDGDFVGLPAIQAVFEKTWRGDPAVRRARFWLSDIVVLTTDQATATATYNWTWEGFHDASPFTIRGRGTRVLRSEGGRFRIVHEHLSRMPHAP